MISTLPVLMVLSVDASCVEGMIESSVELGRTLVLIQVGTGHRSRKVGILLSTQPELSTSFYSQSQMMTISEISQRASLSSWMALHVLLVYPEI